MEKTVPSTNRPTSRIRTILAGGALLTLIVSGLTACGSTDGASVITAPDLDAAAQLVIDEMVPEIAAELDIAAVRADAITACGAIADVSTGSAGPPLVSKIAEPEYASAVEADGENTIENVEFFTIELPYIVALGKHFCPAEAVRANVI